MDIGGSSQSGGKKNSRRTWSKFEEDALLTILEDVVVKCGNRCDNGSFKSGMLKEIEIALTKVIPTSGLKATPHIENKIRMLKKNYGIVYDMLNKSGFGWNDIKKCVEVDSDEAWLSYVQVNKEAEGWRNKCFPIYDRLANIFGKDRAIGRGVETPAEMVENMNQEADENYATEDDDTRSVNQTSSRTSNRKKRSRSENMYEGISEVAHTFKTMFEQSFEHVRLLGERLVQGNENGKDIALELKNMGLSDEDQLDVLTRILAKPEYMSTFMSIDSSLRWTFVRKILREIRDP